MTVGNYTRNLFRVGVLDFIRQLCHSHNLSHRTRSLLPPPATAAKPFVPTAFLLGIAIRPDYFSAALAGEGSPKIVVHRQHALLWAIC
jgi:hypothetical protein